jgi:ELWxxDGT repeat protein
MIRSLRLRRSFLLGFTAGALAVPAFADGPARLLADLARGSLEASEEMSGFARIGSRTAFFRTGDDSPLALWVTDGTAVGTIPLGVLCPPCGSAELLGSSGSIAFYQVSLGYPAMRIWRTDGTPTGTFPVTANLKLPKGVPDSQGLSFRSSLDGGRLFFTACTLELGCELWSSDGSPAGTAPIGEIVAGPGSSDVRELAAAGEQAFLIVSAPDGSLALWLADGPSRSLKLLRETPHARLLSIRDGRAFFIAEGDGLEIWTSDGTAAGTRPITRFAPPDPFGHTGFLRAIDDRIYFLADDGVHGVELWSADAPGQDLRRLTDFSDPSAVVGSMEKAGDRIVFVASQWQRGARLWSSGGDLGTTSALAGCPGACPFVASPLGRAGKGRLVFFGRKQAGEGFWVTDGTGAGTRLLKQSGGRHEAVQTVTAGETVLFDLANEGEAGELWLTDGSAAGTFFVTRGGPGWFRYYGWGAVLEASAANGRLVFAAGQSFSELLWSSDGTPAGSHPLTQNLAARGSDPQRLTPFRDGLLEQNCTGIEEELRLVRGTAITRLVAVQFAGCYAVASAPIELQAAAVFIMSLSLWRTDGTPAGTKTLVPAWIDGDPVGLARFGQQAALSQVTIKPYGFQSQLWLTDGTMAGTRQLFDLPPNVFMFKLTGIGDRLFFFNQEGQGRRAAWRPWTSDGTSAGTYPLTEAIAPHAPFVPLYRLSFVALGGRVFFLLDDGDGRVEIWSTDGTPAGTSPAITAASGMLEPEALSSAGGRLYFAARRSSDPTGPLLPWVSDGTDAGTTPLADVALGQDLFAPLDPVPFTELGDRVFFAAADAAHGEELWITDGTPAGTRLVRDIARGVLGSYPRSLVAWRGRLYFRARDALHGMELWTSDGSRKGTRLVQDIAAGTSWSAPQELTATEQALYFSANDGVHGRELWVLPAVALDGEP